MAFRRRFWMEAGLGSLSGLLLLVTLVWPRWIEPAFGIDPDAGSGSAEWLVVAVTAIVTVLCVLGARIEWRRNHPVTAQTMR